MKSDVRLGAACEATALKEDEAQYAEAQYRAAAKLGTRPTAMQCAMGAAIAFVRRKKALVADNRVGECVAEGHVGQVSNIRPVGETVIVGCPLLFSWAHER